MASFSAGSAPSPDEADYVRFKGPLPGLLAKLHAEEQGSVLRRVRNKAGYGAINMWMACVQKARQNRLILSEKTSNTEDVGAFITPLRPLPMPTRALVFQFMGMENEPIPNVENDGHALSKFGDEALRLAARQRNADREAAVSYYRKLIRQAASKGMTSLTVTQAMMDACPKMQSGDSVSFKHVAGRLITSKYDSNFTVDGIDFFDVKELDAMPCGDAPPHVIAWDVDRLLEETDRGFVEHNKYTSSSSETNNSAGNSSKKQYYVPELLASSGSTLALTHKEKLVEIAQQRRKKERLRVADYYIKYAEAAAEKGHGSVVISQEVIGAQPKTEVDCRFVEVVIPYLRQAGYHMFECHDKQWKMSWLLFN